jgi:hypothetical protein
MEDGIKQTRGILMLVAIATMIFQARITQPGGVHLVKKYIQFKG